MLPQSEQDIAMWSICYGDSCMHRMGRNIASTKLVDKKHACEVPGSSGYCFIVIAVVLVLTGSSRGA